MVELAGDPAGEALGKLLATMGADVIKVELPEGAPSRRIGPAAAGARDGDPDASLNFWFYNVGKRSVVLDYRTADGMERLRGLLRPGRHRDHRLAPGGMGGPRHHPGRAARRRARG